MTEALNGRVTVHHRKIIQRSLEHLEFLERAIADLEADMEQYFAPYRQQEELLQTIPGVGPNVAKVILSEIGTDMSVFPTASHLSSWAGLSSGNRESAGKKTDENHAGQPSPKVGTSRSCVGCQQDPYFSWVQVFWSMAGRKGKKQASVVVAHKILVIAYFVLKTGSPYNELGVDMEKRKTISTEELMIRRLEKQGYVVTKRNGTTD